MLLPAPPGMGSQISGVGQGGIVHRQAQAGTIQIPNRDGGWGCRR
jgi:hypothetical protein